MMNDFLENPLVSKIGCQQLLAYFAHYKQTVKTRNKWFSDEIV